ncbi:MAG: dephospho-CoA kinase [Pseudomonadota bacterium]|nr:dephospho-CoA kinase [Pseudomonadota bacterium]
MTEFIVGLTGGIGSGKSTVAALFEAHGAPVIDSDKIARELSAPGQPAFERIVAEFGPVIVKPDGELNRSRLGEIVFANPQKREALERILHPAIRQVMNARAKGLDAPYCLFEIPLLVETGRHQETDRVLVVEADETIRVERIKARSQLSESRIRQIVSAQVSPEERLAAADDVIDNKGALGALEYQVEKLHRLYMALAKAQAPARQF